MKIAQPVYGASPIKRERRTKARIAILDQQIMQVLEVDRPQSVRHVFYRMTDPRLPEPVEKSDRGYSHVQERITKLRRAGTMPFGWITDSTRRGYHVNTYGSAAEYVRAMSGLYRADIWRQADTYVEVWCESRSIAGVIQRDCEELAVSLYPAGGFSSITLAYEAAEYITYATSEGRKPAVVLYVGDYDPAGVLIDVALERELRGHLPGIALEFKRIAITEQQIELLQLPTKPRKAGDRRALHITGTVEAEAMPAGIMRALVRKHVETYMPAGALAAAKVAEQSEREHIERMATLMERSGYSGLDKPRDRRRR
jgi:hypothetical protein